jgi:hypothetical protein
MVIADILKTKTVKAGTELNGANFLTASRLLYPCLNHQANREGIYASYLGFKEEERSRSANTNCCTNSYCLTPLAICSRLTEARKLKYSSLDIS